MTWILAAVPSEANDIYLLWGFVALAAAVGLLILELFVPSSGLIAVLAGGSLILSIVSFYKHSSTAGTIALVTYLVVGPFAAYYGLRLWLHSPLARRFILGSDDPTSGLTEDEAAAASENARKQRVNRLQALVGVEGVTATALRPVGTVVIEGQRVDALAEEGIIEPDTPVVVIDAYDNQIKVRRKH